jgi:hypothetical protein
LLEGETRSKDPEYFWEHEGNRAVRQGDWKLVALRNGYWELYHLKADPYETKNLVESHPEIANQLMARYEAGRESTASDPGLWIVLNKSKICRVAAFGDRVSRELAPSIGVASDTPTSIDSISSTYSTRP